MITPDYSIVSPDITGTDWAECRLVIELNGHYFHYTIVQDNRIVALKYYQLPSAEGKTATELLQEILTADELLQYNKKETLVVYNLPDSQLIPESLYESNLNNEFIDLVSGDLKKGVVINKKMANIPAYHIFRVPDELHQFFEYNFSPVRYQHYYGLWMEDSWSKENDTDNAVYVAFYPNEFLVKVIANGQLQVMQSYPYQTAEDVGYYLLNIYYQFHFSPEQVPLWVSGMIATDSALYEELLKYFLLVKTIPAPSTLNLTADFALYPEHFFSPILKMTVCVS